MPRLANVITLISAGEGKSSMSITGKVQNDLMMDSLSLDEYVLVHN